MLGWGMDVCVLCGGNLVSYTQDRLRSYLQCTLCSLVQVPEHQRLSSSEEKIEYDKHENNPEDLGYRVFLSRMLDPMLEALAGRDKACISGLDFGSGPEPVLQCMFSEEGVKQDIYDVYYAPNLVCFDEGIEYDFITATEVVEHLYEPSFELQRLWSHLAPEGVLGIMTKRVISLEAFESWHYKNDPTHVCFFSIETFEFLAEKWNAELTTVSTDVVLFRKKT